MGKLKTIFRAPTRDWGISPPPAATAVVAIRNVRLTCAPCKGGAFQWVKGAEGEYNFDEFGAGLHGYNIVRNEKGVIVFDKHIEFTD